MTVEDTMRRLEVLLSDLCFSGLQNAQPVLLGKLDGLRVRMDEVGMARGGLLAGELAETLRRRHRGEADDGECADRFCALEFYCRTVLGNLLQEDE